MDKALLEWMRLVCILDVVGRELSKERFESFTLTLKKDSISVLNYQ
jgi:hypothetical protein